RRPGALQALMAASVGPARLVTHRPRLASTRLRPRGPRRGVAGWRRARSSVTSSCSQGSNEVGPAKAGRRPTPIGGQGNGTVPSTRREAARSLVAADLLLYAPAARPGPVREADDAHRGAFGSHARCIPVLLWQGVPAGQKASTALSDGDADP